MGEAAWEQDFESLLDSPAAMHETLTGPNALRDLEALEAAKLRQGKASTSAAGRKGRVSGRHPHASRGGHGRGGTGEREGAVTFSMAEYTREVSREDVGDDVPWDKASVRELTSGSTDSVDDPLDGRRSESGHWRAGQLLPAGNASAVVFCPLGRVAGGSNEGEAAFADWLGKGRWFGHMHNVGQPLTPILEARTLEREACAEPSGPLPAVEAPPPPGTPAPPDRATDGAKRTGDMKRAASEGAALAALEFRESPLGPLQGLRVEALALQSPASHRREAAADSDQARQRSLSGSAEAGSLKLPALGRRGDAGRAGAGAVAEQEGKGGGGVTPVRGGKAGAAGGRGGKAGGGGGGGGGTGAAMASPLAPLGRRHWAVLEGRTLAFDAARGDAARGDARHRLSRAATEGSAAPAPDAAAAAAALRSGASAGLLGSASPGAPLRARDPARVSSGAGEGPPGAGEAREGAVGPRDALVAHAASWRVASVHEGGRGDVKRDDCASAEERTGPGLLPQSLLSLSLDGHPVLLQQSRSESRARPVRDLDRQVTQSGSEGHLPALRRGVPRELR